MKLIPIIQRVYCPLVKFEVDIKNCNGCKYYMGENQKEINCEIA
jgi:hypothetical protein